jgi:hypothetical protein
MISMEFILIISVKSIIFHRIIYFDEVIISVIKVINEVKEIITLCLFQLLTHLFYFYWALHRLRHFVPNNKRRIDKIRFGKINPVIRFYTVFFPYDQNIIPQTINSQIMRHRQRFDHGLSETTLSSR